MRLRPARLATKTASSAAAVRVTPVPLASSAAKPAEKV